MPDPIGTYTKDGITRYAYTRADVVQLKFDGWHEVTTQSSQVGEAFAAGFQAEVDASLDLDDEAGDES